MSDSVTNIEIEDMLSSIRRLISDDRAGRTVQAGQPDRFLLTPALRVTAEESAAERGRTAMFQHGRPAPVPKPQDQNGENAGLAVDSGPSAAAARTALEQRIAELEEAVSRSREEWEPDGSEADAEDVPARHIFAVASESAHPIDDGKTDDGTPLATADPSVKLDAASPGAEGADGPLAAAPVEPGAVDEATLRRIVTEVVQQELQGALGERITRNLRRMVRREIQQALTLKDFD